MTELMEYYKQRQKVLLNVYAVLWFTVSGISFLFLDQILISALTCLNSFVNLGWLLVDESRIFIKFIAFFIDFCLPASLIWRLYLYHLDYHNKEGWKKHFPQYDINGVWVDQTIYTNMIHDNQWISTDTMADKLKDMGWSSENSLPVIPSSVVIMQTCQMIKIGISDGKGFMWRSLSAEWNDDSLKILYEVTYNNVLRNIGYPQQRYGFEKVHIDGADPQKKSKPERMTGQFWHCIADDGKPILMGDVTYVREKAENV